MNEKDTPQEEKQTTYQSNSKKTMARVQKYNQEEIWKHLLYVSPDKLIWKQLAHGTHVAEGKSGSVFEVRLTSITPTVLQLQYKSRGNGGGLLYKNVKRNGTRANGKVGKRPPKDSKCV